VTENSDASSGTGLSRRTVVKAAAWSVPIIALGSNAPAMAASPIFELTGDACKLPGNSQSVYKGYAFGVNATNPYGCPITITITSLTLDGQDLGQVLIVQTTPTCTSGAVNTLTIPAGTTLTDLVVLTENAPNSQQGVVTASYTIAGACVPGGTETSSGTATAAPPIQGSTCADSFTQAQIDCVTSIIGT
jgi:hypothetical protein